MSNQTAVQPLTQKTATATAAAPYPQSLLDRSQVLVERLPIFIWLIQQFLQPLFG